MLSETILLRSRIQLLSNINLIQKDFGNMLILKLTILKKLGT